MFGGQKLKRSRAARQGWGTRKARRLVSAGIPGLFYPKRQAANGRRRWRRSGSL